MLVEGAIAGDRALWAPPPVSLGRPVAEARGADEEGMRESSVGEPQSQEPLVLGCWDALIYCNPNLGP